MYNVSTYTMAQGLTEMPYLIVQVTGVETERGMFNLVSHGHLPLNLTQACAHACHTTWMINPIPIQPQPLRSTLALTPKPLTPTQSIVYTLMVYFLVGFEADAAKFFWFWLFFLLNLMAFTFFGQLLGT